MSEDLHGNSPKFKAFLKRRFRFENVVKYKIISFPTILCFERRNKKRKQINRIPYLFK